MANQLKLSEIHSLLVLSVGDLSIGQFNDLAAALGSTPHGVVSDENAGSPFDQRLRDVFPPVPAPSDGTLVQLLAKVRSDLAKAVAARELILPTQAALVTQTWATLANAERMSATDPAAALDIARSAEVMVGDLRAPVTQVGGKVGTSADPEAEPGH